MRTINLILFLLFSSSFCFCQQQLKENQFEGYIILKGGQKKEGIVEIDNVKYPWSFQGNIKFFDKSLLLQEKISNKDKKEYKPGDVIEYGFGKNRFLLVSYTNNNRPEGNSLTTGLAALKSVSHTKYFAELYHEGKVSLFRFYTTPPDFYVTSGNEEANNMAQFIEECKTTYDILIEKGDEKAKAFDEINIKKFFKDCDFVVEKYKNEKYTKKPVKGFKSLVKNANLRGEPLAAAAMEMIVDYEANCGK